MTPATKARFDQITYVVLILSFAAMSLFDIYSLVTHRHPQNRMFLLMRLLMDPIFVINTVVFRKRQSVTPQTV